MKRRPLYVMESQPYVRHAKRRAWTDGFLCGLFLMAIAAIALRMAL